MTKGRSKLILALAAYFGLSAAYNLYLLVVSFGVRSLGDQLYEAAYIVIIGAVAFGLYRHLRWAMWLYLASAAVAAAIWVIQDPLASIDPQHHTGVVIFTLLFLIVPGVLIWLRRDRLSSSPIEPRNA